MNSIFKHISLIIALTFIGAMASCVDDKIYLEEIGDGTAQITGAVSFRKYTPGLSRGTDGYVLDGLDRVTVLIYDLNGDIVGEPHVFTADDGLTVVNDNNQAPGNAYNPEEDVLTPVGKFNMSLPYGKYYIFAVGNADMTGKDVSTVQKLKDIAFDWEENVSLNNQMFGYFSTDDMTTVKAATFNKETGYLEASPVTINKPGIELSAWLVRLASKVTISYDASGLKENVYIFLKKVTIKDIPVSCTLGKSNTPVSKDQLIPEGESIKYYTDKEPLTSAEFNSDYPSILTKADSNFGSMHSHASEALFFYENNQGIGKNKGQDVVDNTTTGQTPGGEFNPGSGKSDGIIDFPNGNSDDENTGYKDEKRFGTYIEVEAYYRSNNPERLGEGKIIYRFMLGQNTTDNYDAKRNFHYKLTLKFNGFANDVDWHIEYEQQPDIYIPDPYYISYIYDKSLDLPIQIKGKAAPGSKLSAEIIENEWMPYAYFEDKIDYPVDEYYNVDNPELTGDCKPTEAQYNQTQKLFNGFLSLTNPGVRTSIGEQLEQGQSFESVNSDYWNSRQQGKMEYELTNGSHTFNIGHQDTDYSVDVNEEEEKTIVYVPMFTRPKNLVKASGYTGNNPYVGYQRKAVVRFSAKLWNEEAGKYVEVTKDVTIIQVRRIVNPKGIWRDWNEDASFDVHLLQLNTEYTPDPWTATNSFVEFESIGPWSAEIMAQGGDDGSDWIILNSLKESVKGNDGKIYGITGSTIDFTFEPKGKLSSADKVRYGIIKVKYHNYTCEHLIFVRQGYAPISLYEGGTKWYSFNMNSQGEMAKSPCDEGSLFKRFRWDKPISALNNKEDFPFKVKPGDLKLFPDGTAQWNSWYTDKNATEWTAPTVAGKKMRVATVDDYVDLYDSSNTRNIEQGYGILYDGSATVVQYPVKNAYSYYYDNPTSGWGMRGCFVYNEQTGANIFLPIGAAGYGRRREVNRTSWSNPIDNGTFYPGMLIYGQRNTFLPASLASTMPLLFDLFRRPGALYWANKTKPGEAITGNGGTKESVGWDFNYITFDFFPIAASNVIDYGDATKTDALRVRCVVDESN